VYASSVAAYGFHPDNPVGMDEGWPTRPADHLFYAREKAELEQTLAEESARHPDLGLYLLRPPVVLGPHAVGGKSELVARVLPAALGALRLLERSPVPVPLPIPDLPAQFVHEDDVGSAFLQCILGAGPPGAYNITGDGIVTGPELARELGFWPVPLPAGLSWRAARTVSGLPVPSFVPPVTGWAEALAHPAIMDASKAKRELHWAPRYTSLEAVRATLRPEG
jgi:nucleoside-diphosphate-sugar epimerase